MVGRDLPKSCPNGEDHQGRRGAGDANSGSMIRPGGRRKLVWRSLIVMIQIYKALI